MSHITTVALVDPSHTFCQGCGLPAWRHMLIQRDHSHVALCRTCALDAIVALAAPLRREMDLFEKP